MVTSNGYFKEISILGLTTYHIFFNYYPKCLKSLIREKILPTDFQRIKLYFYQLIETLAFLQTHGIAHRDIKPENVLLDDKEEKVVLSDFGIAGKIKEMVNDRKFSGTYYSPEWMKLWYKNEDPSDTMDFIKTDSFNLGLVTLEMAGIGVNFSKSKDFDEYVKDLEGKIGVFKSKFQKEINENEDNLNFSKDLEDLLKVNPEDRADFLKIFFLRWKLEDKGKLKYNILVEDMNENELIRFSMKKIKIMREIYDSLGDFLTSIESKPIKDLQFTKSVIKRHQLIKDLSSINYPKALLFRGIQFKYGILVTRNISKAKQLFEKVLEFKENGYCLYLLGTIQKDEHEISFKPNKLTRKDLIFLSKMAEKAERFHDFVVLMRKIVLKHPDLTVEERDMFYKGHKSLLSRLRTTRGSLVSLQEPHEYYSRIQKRN